MVTEDVSESNRSDGKTFIIQDKAGNGLVKTFLESLSCSETQLIISTRNLDVLSLEIFRRDEIWFVTEDDNNSSGIVTLSDFKEVFDNKLKSAYLEGRFC